MTVNKIHLVDITHYFPTVSPQIGSPSLNLSLPCNYYELWLWLRLTEVDLVTKPRSRQIIRHLGWDNKLGLGNVRSEKHTLPRPPLFPSF